MFHWSLVSISITLFSILELVLDIDSSFCGFLTFQCKHSASRSNQSSIWSLAHTDGTGYCAVVIRTLKVYEPRHEKNSLWGFPQGQTAQPQEMARGLKFQISEVNGLFYLCSENKGADQLRSICAADLRLCFRICKKRIFS